MGAPLGNKNALGSTNNGGRPTNYNDALVDKAQDYLVNYSNHGHVIPSIAGLAQVLDITRETIYDWEGQEDKLMFSDIVAKLRTIQECALLNGGLSGTMNSTISKLILGKHGYHDKQDTNLGGQKDNPVKMDATISPDDAYLRMIGKQ